MQKTISNRADGLLYLLSFVMLWQCVRPVTELTILQNEVIFFVFVGVSMVMSFLRLPALLNFSVNLVMILFSLHYFYFPDERLISGTWVRIVGQDLYQNTGMLFHGDLFFLSDIFTTFILFILLWLISIAMSHWIRRARSFLLFFFLALFCLSMLDSFTFYEADRSIVIVIITGLLVLGIQKYVQMKEKGEITDGKKARIHWFRIVGLGVAVILVLGLIGPKLDAQWAAPTFQPLSVSGSDRNGSIFSTGQRIGYDEDDSHLGGSLGMDTTSLFTVRTNGDGAYWRVESKNSYTGRGWESQNEQPVPLNIPYDRYPALSQYGPDTYKNERKAMITFTNASPDILPYTGQLTGMNADGRQLRLNASTGKIRTEGREPVSQAILHYQEPTYQIPKLRQVTDGRNDPAMISEQNLQLPDSLPERVRTLADRITASASNRYDQVNAVVDYLRSDRFAYSTTGVPSPSDGQDYVDQFLFESKIGYCDNFSTSMVVLLRSAGIPARWVKGFSTGSFRQQTNMELEGKQVLVSEYELTNANAHSWVEVYFPGSGWVTFEPTPSFTNPGSFTTFTSDGADGSSSGEETGSSTPEEAQTPEQEQPQNPESQNPAESTPQDGQSTGENGETETGTGSDRSLLSAVNLSVIYWLIGILLAAAVVILILTRKRWLARFYIRRQEKMQIRDQSSFFNAYRNLLRLLHIKGMNRKDAQTLREYAKSVDTIITGSQMAELTRYYESMIYSDRKAFTEKERLELNSLCGTIIRRLSV